MMNSKEQTNTLTNDELYNLYLNSKLQKSIDDIKNGRVMTLEELKKYIDELEEKHATDNTK